MKKCPALHCQWSDPVTCPLDRSHCSIRSRIENDLSLLAAAEKDIDNSPVQLSLPFVFD